MSSSAEPVLSKVNAIVIKSINVKNDFGRNKSDLLHLLSTCPNLFGIFKTILQRERKLRENAVFGYLLKVTYM